MAKSKSQRKSQPKKQADNVFTGTEKLVNTIIKAYKVGGMSLSLVGIGTIGLIFTFLFRSTLDIIAFIAFIIICILLFGAGVYIHLKEKKII